MKSIFLILSLFLSSCSCSGQLSSMVSGYDSANRSELIRLIKLRPEGEKPTLAKLKSRLNDSTVLVKVYAGAFLSDGYNFEKNPLDFIQYWNDYTWIIYNDTVVASCTQKSDSTYSCGDSFTKGVYNVIKSVFQEPDFSRIAVWQLGFDFYICYDKKLYVIDNNKLIEFNTYYKSKYTLKEFLEMY